MKDFIEWRNNLLRIFEFNDPDFVQPGLLPVNARLAGDPKHDVPDEWNDLCKRPLAWMTEEEWNSCYPTIARVCTRPYDCNINTECEDEDQDEARMD